MSHSLVAKARWRRIGESSAGSSELLRKAVLCTLADLADNADGAGISASVPVIAQLAGCSARMVQKALAEFVAEGLLEQTGTRACRGGYTREWRLVVAKLEALPLVEVAQRRRTSKRESGAMATPVRADAKVAQQCRTSPEVVKRSALSGEEASPKTLSSTTSAAGAGPKNEGKSSWQIVVDEVNSPWLDPHKTQWLITEGAIVAGWLRAGADLEIDVIPTVRRIVDRERRPLDRWGYFGPAVREAVAARLAAEQEQPKIEPAAPRHNGLAPQSGGKARLSAAMAHPEDARIRADLIALGLTAEAHAFDEALREASRKRGNSGAIQLLRARRAWQETIDAEKGEANVGH